MAEKENQKLLERKKIEEEERRQEEELKRQLEMERRQMEEERKRIQEKKVLRRRRYITARLLPTLNVQEAEERRLQAVKEAIAGAQQNALAEKMARRKALQCRAQQEAEATTVAAATVTVAPPDVTVLAPSQSPAPHQRGESLERQDNSNNRLVDAQVQTDQLLKVPCHCDKPPTRGQERRR